MNGFGEMAGDVDSGSELDEFDRQVLHLLQREFPVSARPYLELAAKLGISETELLGRVRLLFGQGYIRRLGASINGNQVGYTSILVALKVTAERIADVARLVNDFAGVTHNYLREGDYNMWFTAIAANKADLNALLQTVAAADGVKKLVPLPAKRVFKVNVRFPLIAG
jgi:DNA-binding Lrp family transcriptional regulator